MSDERDETRRFSPFDDETWADDAPRPSRERPRRSSAPSGAPADETRAEFPRTPEGRPDDPTVVAGAAGPTEVLPPATADQDQPWEGRAAVRAPQPTENAYPTGDWPAPPGREPRDRWWMPIVVGIVVLILLALLGWGIYLIVQNAGKDDKPAPLATTSAPPAPTTAASTETTEPSSAPTTTTTPSPTPSTTNPTDEAVTIPALKGLDVADAKQALQQVGIHATRVIYVANSASPGTVFDSDPEEGQEVPPDTTVTLVVAAPSTSSPTSAGTGSTPTTGN